MKYAWIRQQQDSYPAGIVCDVLGVSRSGYYAWIDRKPSAQTQRRQQIAQAVRQSHKDSHGIYGYRRVHGDLVKDSPVDCCEETVRNVMAELGLSGKQNRRFDRRSSTAKSSEETVCRQVPVPRRSSRLSLRPVFNGLTMPCPLSRT